MNVVIENTTKLEQEVALNSVNSLKKGEKNGRMNKTKIVKLSLPESNEIIEIPLKAFTLLKSILSNMAEGKSMALILSDSKISTQQAANILNVSRPHLVKLLENGKIPFRKVGSHRRIQLNDLIDYKIKIKANKRAYLNELAKEAQALNLGYE